MHLRVTLGGKYTNVVADIPVPIMDWIWQRLHDKYFAEKFAESEKLRQIEAARQLYEKAAEVQRLQTLLQAAKDIGVDATSLDGNSKDTLAKILQPGRNGREKANAKRKPQFNFSNDAR